MSDVTWTLVRAANATEIRTIVRQKYRHYNNLFVAGIYTVRQGKADLTKIETFAASLRACLKQHPFLNVVIKPTKSGYEYTRPSTIDLRNHFHLIVLSDLGLDASVPEDEVLNHAFEHIANGLSFFETAEIVPSWRINVLSLADHNGFSRAVIAFTFPHTNGDGMSAMAFHKTFLAELNQPKIEKTHVLLVPSAAGELQSIPKLPVSWSYLLGPALGHYLPKRLADLLGLKPSVTGSDENTWVATEAFTNSSGAEIAALTCVEVCQIEASILCGVLSACKKHHTKLTPLLNQLLATAFFRQLKQYKELEEFHLISTTPINLRNAAGVSSDEMGLFASAVYTRYEQEHTRKPFEISDQRGMNDEMWLQAQQASVQTQQAASSLHNQPIGLLSYIPDFDNWQAEKVGKARDSSWELSNVMSFDETRHDLSIQKMFFCQPADVGGPPIAFNVVSVKGGVLIICASWQMGGLGLDSKPDQFTRGVVRVSKDMSSEQQDVEKVERDFVKVLLSSLRADLDVVANE